MAERRPGWSPDDQRFREQSRSRAGLPASFTRIATGTNLACRAGQDSANRLLMPLQEDRTMIRRREFAIAGMSAAALAALKATGFAAPGDRGRGHDRDDMFSKCARACSDCQRECDACATHCAESMAEGAKHHLATLMSCRDCADVCSTAAQIVARGGPYADLICQACAEVCARCAKECEHHGRDDKVMARCAEECRKCETACRAMLSHADRSR